ncbi:MULTISPECIES: ATP-grasp ribosomal peptide maturase [Actinoalloteichus]|uniref:ATP-grasp ribosomal peptide maturase n=1 Tax=Actinoalloteichus fjordicus TaxID=1612552 RepID=A0AAC9LGK6_9PSEU|nr:MULTISPECIES: ATP-grasp ribosomal peptide maturase [Actinoalloteichus]APU15985.1 ATP-grasp ribosomal peptide maturase [Actinoalloteichus fjordicus]APU22049.1 ATP-grasp ribosomal peptide maturase [Actinoalloteichus sp. GBA129-24]
MTVLIFAQDFDRSADQVVLKLNEREVPVLRIDTSWFPQQLTMDAEFDGGRWVGELRTPHRSIALESLRSAWYRSPTAFEFPAGLSRAEREHANREAKLGLGGVLSSLPLCWVNHPNRAADAVYKPLQLAVAARCGLTVSRTLISNDPHAVRRFARDSRTGVVNKALGTSRVLEEGVRKIGFTRRLTDEDFSDLRGIDVTLHQMQDWVEKDHEARVVVIGDTMNAVGIYAGSEASHTDWRSDHDALTYKVLDLPPGVRRGLQAFMAEFRITYSAFDFVITPSGQWVLLESNPGGQYGWLEARTGVPLTDTLVDLLMHGVPT